MAQEMQKLIDKLAVRPHVRAKTANQIQCSYPQVPEGSIVSRLSLYLL